MNIFESKNGRSVWREWQYKNGIRNHRSNIKKRKEPAPNEMELVN